MKPFKVDIIDRIIDANINRVKEGLRVCEEVARFILNSRNLTAKFKDIRHKINRACKGLPEKTILITTRSSLDDVGLNIRLKNEYRRKDYRDIFFANIQRVKESLRVLEEFSKLKNTNVSAGFKRIRYNIYDLEKKIIKKIT